MLIGPIALCIHFSPCKASLTLLKRSILFSSSYRCFVLVLVALVAAAALVALIVFVSRPKKDMVVFNLDRLLDFVYNSFSLSLSLSLSFSSSSSSSYNPLKLPPILVVDVLSLAAPSVLSILPFEEPPVDPRKPLTLNRFESCALKEGRLKIREARDIILLFDLIASLPRPSSVDALLNSEARLLFIAEKLNSALPRDAMCVFLRAAIREIPCLPRPRVVVVPVIVTEDVVTEICEVELTTDGASCPLDEDALLLEASFSSAPTSSEPNASAAKCSEGV